MRSLALFLILPGTGILWADADFGLRTKHTATLRVSRPPDAMLRGKTITIRSRDGDKFTDRQTLEFAIERSLAGECTPAKDGRDLVLTFAVASFEPVKSRTFTVTEKRSIVVGKKKQKLLFSDKLIDVDDVQEREVPVEYWEAQGALSLQLTVNDASGALVDSFHTEGKFSRKQEIAVQGVSKATGILPTPDALQTELITKVANDIQRRYTKTIEPVAVRLTVDEPLRTGNALAMRGQWKEALDSWSSVPMKKNPGDRSYNMAVAHEALAYQAYDSSRNPDDAVEQFQQAIKLYEEAQRSDPKEKYFESAMGRCDKLRLNFARAKAQYEQQERVAATEFAKAEAKQKEEAARRQLEEEKEKTLNSTRADTQDEADFRVIARSRLKNVQGAPSSELEGQLIQLGQDAYKLESLGARRVIRGELTYLTKTRVNLELYKQTFQDLVGTDKVLDAKDRADLNQLAQRLNLTPAQLSPVEAQFEYRNLTLPPPSAPSAKAKPAVTKPAVVAAKPSTVPAANVPKAPPAATPGVIRK